MLTKALLAVSLLALTEAYSYGPDMPRVPFCGKTFANSKCCNGRIDDCSHEIRGTLCYCDEFCTRNHTKQDDCCPDYESVCLGVEAPPEAFSVCAAGETRMENCNECLCKKVGAFDTDWECPEDPCLISEKVISSVNERRPGWRASNYTDFWGRKLSEGMKLKLGTLPLSPSTLSMRSDPSYTEKPTFPESFDARSRWPRFISPVYDQGWCGSDWAVSTAAVASDRFAIQSNGAEKVFLSSQQLISCATHRQRGCNGGHIDRAWIFSRKYGLVDEECYPYSGTSSGMKKCPSNRGSLQAAGCRRTKNGRTERYKTSPPKRLGSVDDIMYEIMTSGPVQAVMTVHHDFFHYRDGIYRHTPSAAGNEEIKGLHSVRILGWGEDKGDKYWLVANSWGEQWGENGFFRIARGENESDIERFVVATLAYVMEANNVMKKK